ncbi:MAG: enhanced serine sensitivity protein SseB C-terminal domain-containing protein [Ignavibacteriae bacterium]|nr:enhanced serine sensitivity protein SseB C-terminal domain-containing protein [Ignavibacteriota bacterium]
MPYKKQMSILNNLFKKPYSIFNIKESNIEFCEEVSGDGVELICSIWTSDLKTFFEVKEAYLILTKFKKNEQPNPTICIYPEISNSKSLVKKLSISIKEHFDTDQFIDILFLDNQMQIICKSKFEPFYENKN